MGVLPGVGIEQQKLAESVNSSYPAFVCLFQTHHIGTSTRFVDAATLISLNHFCPKKIHLFLNGFSVFLDFLVLTSRA